jgi:putative acetyltransferase
VILVNFIHIFTDEKNQDFIDLSKELWDEYYENEGNIVDKYQEVNNLEGKHFAILLFNNYKTNTINSPIACGSFKEISDNIVEIKRVFVKPLYRNNGLGTFIMENLEKEAKNRDYDYSVLITGINNFSSQSLYKNLGYNLIEGFGIFKGDPDSLCFKKKL